MSQLQEYHHILAPVDGSEEAKLAFHKAVAVAQRNDAELTIANVVDTRSVQMAVEYESMLSNELVKQAEDLLEEYKEYAEKNGVKKVDALIEYGSPKAKIAEDIPKDKHIDLIMIGATGLNAIERLFIGSVSSYVTQHALCDVLVVRTDLDNKEIELED